MEKDRGIRYFPIGLFASVMGFSGVTIAIREAETLYEFNSFTSMLFLIVTTLFFLINGSIFLYRLVRYFRDVKADFNHPVKMNFFAAISISLLLLAVIYYEISYGVAFTFWIAGSLLQISLTLLILTRLVWHHQFKIEQFNPAWFIPIVGNIVVPIGGTLLNVPAEINGLFFGIGILFSVIYLSLFFYRAVFYAPLPDMLLPTYFILMAPPAIGFVSYVNITGSVDTFANLLYGIAFFIGLFLLFQGSRWIRIPFFVPWWAFLFPSAAMTIATFRMYIESGNVVLEWLFIVQLIGLIGLAVYLVWKTIQLALRGKLCVKEG